MSVNKEQPHGKVIRGAVPPAAGAFVEHVQRARSSTHTWTHIDTYSVVFKHDSIARVDAVIPVYTWEN